MITTCSVAPHGFSIIEEIAGPEKEMFKKTRDSMIEMGELIMKDRPDTIVVLTPHGLRLRGFNGIYTTAYCRGSLSQFDVSVSLDYKCDTDLSNEILDALDQTDIPVVGCNYGALSGEFSNIEMDWGTLIPLWFCTADYQPEIVVIAPTREIPKTQLIEMGKVMGNIFNRSKKKIAVIASADQGHCHDKDGPYGYHESSKILDEKVMALVVADDLEKLLYIEESLIEDAKPDSIWQMLILHGILGDSKKGRLLSYEVPTYFGMAVAVYE
ncbi:hypothetical protein EZV73_06435 [Acidaminobacter sp. JC074]|uniref:DODA-type extradiol aromatic ring-opening family dioxygenase n=1 Tax=Acidaminobacter sp. JC074 TaxID=2530199 RepID=UPI001F0D88D8|nr:hypothetical protein [Acidaminobacter sp. JC074]MCH4887199.1 hypothetical protein [Acidaminobacter sp. JC074]